MQIIRVSHGDTVKNIKRVIVLGFFDCIHLGHIELIKRAKEIAHRDGLVVSIVTFSNNPQSVLGKSQKLVYTFSERVDKLEELGVDEVIAFDFNEEFKNKQGKDFLESISKWNLTCVVCGYDYTYGRNRDSVSQLIEFFDSKNTTVEVVQEYQVNGQRVSSSMIRELLLKGQIKEVNNLLGELYRIKGVVASGRKVGRELGYPTVNLTVESEKQQLLEGVYCGSVCIKSKEYAVAVNIGDKPTFFDETRTIEGYILEYSDDIYGEMITLRIKERIRDIKKFSKEELKKQIQKDVEKIKSIMRLK